MASRAGGGFFEGQHSPYNIQVKHEHNQQKWNEILKNKEANIAIKHKKLRDQLARK